MDMSWYSGLVNQGQMGRSLSKKTGLRSSGQSDLNLASGAPPRLLSCSCTSTSGFFFSTASRDSRRQLVELKYPLERKTRTSADSLTYCSRLPTSLRSYTSRKTRTLGIIIISMLRITATCACPVGHLCERKMWYVWSCARVSTGGASVRSMQSSFSLFFCLRRHSTQAATDAKHSTATQTATMVTTSTPSSPPPSSVGGSVADGVTREPPL
mmetsp:Transcript_51324/g.111632  ORF Transcript_51324/g.111632 Transcript_51324/m.111632 type:complete len:212 (+) Transcript_51324:1741-2376(+)